VSTQIAIHKDLTTGQKMSREEFLRRWEDLPELKKAELIDGVVHVSSPVSPDHGFHDSSLIWWLSQYAFSTPGCQCGNNITWTMRKDAPQPDSFLRILPAWGGQSRDGIKYCEGAPELAVEICVTSTEVDFGPKLRLYERAGVQEYITAETLRRRLVWRLLEGGVYVAQQIPEDGILRSQVFPGLWLDVAAFWEDDKTRMMAALAQGLATEEHRQFAGRLQSARAATVAADDARLD
jgi:Uma2 family endonuclease